MMQRKHSRRLSSSTRPDGSHNVGGSFNKATSSGNGGATLTRRISDVGVRDPPGKIIVSGNDSDVKRHASTTAAIAVVEVPPHSYGSSWIPSESSSDASIDTGNNGRASPGHDRLFRRLLLLILAVSAANVGSIYASHGHHHHLGGYDSSHWLLPSMDRRRFDPRRSNGVSLSGKAVASPVAAVGGGNTGSDYNDDDAHRIRKILERANMTVDAELERRLPPWSSFVSQYGSKPRILGLEKCEEFRATVPPERRFVGPAGIFNTGTNLMFQLLSRNCVIEENLHEALKRQHKRSFGMLWQVPWGKHNPPSWRFRNVAKVHGEGIPQGDVLPVVMVKDPYHWMLSMCRHHYTATWVHSQRDCATLGPGLASKRGGKEHVHEVRVAFKPPGRNVTHHEGLAGLWNDWYGWYEKDADFPYITVRSEDLLVHPAYVLKTVCKCAGGKLKEKVEYSLEESVKGKRDHLHRNSNGLVESLVRYGDPERRLEGYTEYDQKFAEKLLRKDLMERYGYTQPHFSLGR